MQQSDEALVADIKRGSQAAMEVLIRRHYASVFALVYRKTGDYHTACDLTQEVFIKVAKSISAYQGDGRFKNWLTRITYHHCTDFFRSAENKRRQGEMAIQSQLPDESKNIFNLLERKDERSMVKTALMQLPDYQRDTIVLSYYEGMKIRQIAELMTCSESTVKSRMHQGLKKLKKLLERGDKHEETGRHSGVGSAIQRER